MLAQMVIYYTRDIFNTGFVVYELAMFLPGRDHPIMAEIRRKNDKQTVNPSNIGSCDPENIRNIARFLNICAMVAENGGSIILNPPEYVTFIEDDLTKRS